MPDTFHPLIAHSPRTVEALGIAERIGAVDSPVFITGESGVGKELFAEQVHLHSKRKDAPLVRVNCAAMPEQLFESELFGYVRGAFTGALESRRGRFEIADGGSIFLDEIGDLSFTLQAKLLRVLQQKTFEKVGSDVSVNADIRVIAATNKNIEEMVEQGAFRPDLYYRLNVLPLYVPPLRDRREDILPLADFFLNRIVQRNKAPVSGFTPDARNALLAYRWPGNIRELENCVERAYVLKSDSRIQIEDLFLQPEETDSDSGLSLKEAVNWYKVRYIRRVLAEHNGNQTKTAQALQIQRTYLLKLIKELKIH
ncbi:hypothetical protein FACS1894172_02330 [Spirochaetia bacterium]|nr:hypothetical protein FACS1894172_02330 [Spirochaetia bacterium]